MEGKEVVVSLGDLPLKEWGVATERIGVVFLGMVRCMGDHMRRHGRAARMCMRMRVSMVMRMSMSRWFIENFDGI
jgi:hypothetical protein